MTISAHIVSSYEQQIDMLVSDLSSMGSHASQLLSLLAQLIAASAPKAQEGWWQGAQAIDKQINELDYKVEQNATSILALRQPMGIDLRLAISAVKLSVIFERIGDLAKGAVRRLAEEPTSLAQPERDAVAKLTKDVTQMVELVASGVTAIALEQVKLIHEQDNQIDDEYRNLIRHCIKAMQEADADPEYYLHVILVIKNIERIGDYANKIAKISYYIHSGERVANHDLDQ